MAFQAGFQSNSFQVVTVIKRAPNGNLTSYTYTPRSYELEKFRRAEKLAQLKELKRETEIDLKAQELKIEEMELQRLREGLEDAQLQLDLMALLLLQQEMLATQARLQKEIDALIEEDEAIMVILLTMSL